MNTSPRLHLHPPGTPLVGDIRYALGECRYGVLLVARNDEGLCAIFLGDHAEPLREQIRQVFPSHLLIETPSELQRELAQVAALIAEPSTATRLDLCLGGTAFQQRVWRALCDIPAGNTCSYQQVADNVGAPTAVRAVASACAANLLAVAIPCHRVVRSDGSLSGYRWGTERKRRLLQQEREQ